MQQGQLAPGDEQAPQETLHVRHGLTARHCGDGGVADEQVAHVHSPLEGRDRSLKGGPRAVEPRPVVVDPVRVGEVKWMAGGLGGRWPGQRCHGRVQVDEGLELRSLHSRVGQRGRVLRRDAPRPECLNQLVQGAKVARGSQESKVVACMRNNGFAAGGNRERKKEPISSICAPPRIQAAWRRMRDSTVLTARSTASRLMRGDHLSRSTPCGVE
jgi:hypothetical protein